MKTREEQIEQNFQNIKNGSLIFAWEFDPYDTPFIVVAKKENDKIYARTKITNSGVIVLDGYRKQSDTAREILRMIKDKGLFRYGGYLLHDSDFDTIGKLYGVEVEE